MPLRLELVTAERVVLQEDADMIIAPAADGQVGILPHHAPFLTTLRPGELRVRQGGTEQELVVTGGFMEVLNDKVTILADAAERIEEIDVARAEEARRNAADALANRQAGVDTAAAELAMRRAVVRLSIARRRRVGGGRPEPGSGA
jgi:F-type H+-transporting ATPase subunit epsilon